MKKTTLKKIDFIRKHAYLYQIVFREQGVGLEFFESTKLDASELQMWYRVDRLVGTKDILLHKALIVYGYYPTLAKAVDAEYKRIVGGSMN